jgi:hypothetical protein
MSMSVAASVSGLSRRPRSYGGMGSNSGRGGGSESLGRRNPLPCFESQSHAGFFLNLTFATRKALNGLGEAKASEVLKPKMSLT